MRFRRRLTFETAPNLIPLIDVVFQLVIFFMVATTCVITPARSQHRTVSEGTPASNARAGAYRCAGESPAGGAQPGSWSSSRSATSQP